MGFGFGPWSQFGLCITAHHKVVKIIIFLISTKIQGRILDLKICFVALKPNTVLWILTNIVSNHNRVCRQLLYMVYLGNKVR